MSRRSEQEEWAKAVALELPNICDDPNDLLWFPKGWRDIVYVALIKIEAIAAKEGISIKIAQIKEKYGGLCMYFHGKFDRQKIQDIIDKATTSCYYTCEKCGLSGTIRTDLAWHQTLCDSHYLDQKKTIPFGGLNKSGS